jgi:CDP-diacylglycerol--glycerol-3-phosphate 3-phosphatidyltransferase
MAEAEGTGESAALAPRARLTSLPNLLGVARIAATPVVIVLLLNPFPAAGLLAFVVFALAAATDFVDGRIARARGEVSPLGIFMDLTADKVLVAGVLVAMVEVGLLPTWMVALLLIRELVVQGVRQLAASADVVIAARALGKGKTFATLLGMGLLLLAFDADTGGPLAGLDAGSLLLALGYWTVLVATALSVASGWDYIRGALPLLLGNQPDQPGRPHEPDAPVEPPRVQPPT